MSTNGYRITTEPQKTMFGKRTGSVLARLESDYSSNIAQAAGPTATLAKDALIGQLARLAANDQRAYLFCGNGETILVVSFIGDCWQYDIVDKAHRAGCIMPSVTSFKDAKARAYDHAEQSYGGIVADR